MAFPSSLPIPVNHLEPLLQPSLPPPPVNPVSNFSSLSLRMCQTNLGKEQIEQPSRYVSFKSLLFSPSSPVQCPSLLPSSSVRLPVVTSPHSLTPYPGDEATPSKISCFLPSLDYLSPSLLIGIPKGQLTITKNTFYSLSSSGHYLQGS